MPAGRKGDSETRQPDDLERDWAEQPASDESSALVPAIDAVGRAYLDATYGRGDPGDLNEILDDDCRISSDAGDGNDRTMDKATLVATAQVARQAFSNATFVIESQETRGDHIKYECRWGATHTGPVGPHSPTNRRVEVRFSDILCVANGRVVAVRSVADPPTVMEQLGLRESAVVHRAALGSVSANPGATAIRRGASPAVRTRGFKQVTYHMGTLLADGEMVQAVASAHRVAAGAGRGWMLLVLTNRRLLVGGRTEDRESVVIDLPWDKIDFIEGLRHNGAWYALSWINPLEITGAFTPEIRIRSGAETLAFRQITPSRLAGDFVRMTVDQWEQHHHPGQRSLKTPFKSSDRLARTIATLVTDIKAATSPSDPASPAREERIDQIAAEDALLARLERLAKLKQDGALSVEEFEEQKHRLLGTDAGAT